MQAQNFCIFVVAVTLGIAMKSGKFFANSILIENVGNPALDVSAASIMENDHSLMSNQTLGHRGQGENHGVLKFHCPQVCVQCADPSRTVMISRDLPEKTKFLVDSVAQAVGFISKIGEIVGRQAMEAMVARSAGCRDVGFKAHTAGPNRDPSLEADLKRLRASKRVVEISRTSNIKNIKDNREKSEKDSIALVTTILDKIGYKPPAGKTHKDLARDYLNSTIDESVFVETLISKDMTYTFSLSMLDVVPDSQQDAEVVTYKQACKQLVELKLQMGNVERLGANKAFFGAAEKCLKHAWLCGNKGVQKMWKKRQVLTDCAESQGSNPEDDKADESPTPSK